MTSMEVDKNTKGLARVYIYKFLDALTNFIHKKAEMMVGYLSMRKGRNGGMTTKNGD